MYAINNAQSLHDLHVWSNEVANHADILKILVGNKNDLVDERQIEEQTAVDFALMENIDLAVECSAKIDDNIDYIFYTIAKKLLSRRLEEVSDTKITKNRVNTTKSGDGAIKYQGASASMENLFVSPRTARKKCNHNKVDENNRSTLQLNQFKPRRSFFDRICTILWRILWLAVFQMLEIFILFTLHGSVKKYPI